MMLTTSNTVLVWAGILTGLCSNVSAFTIPNVARTVGSRTTLSMVADDAKVILVTGSSRGLGRSIALDLGKHQQKVVVNYVSEGSKASAEATVEEIKSLGGDAIAVQADSKLLSNSYEASTPNVRELTCTFMNHIATLQFSTSSL
jgi:hypothetical protein